MEGIFQDANYLKVVYPYMEPVCLNPQVHVSECLWQLSGQDESVEWFTYLLQHRSDGWYCMEHSSVWPWLLSYPSTHECSFPANQTLGDVNIWTRTVHSIRFKVMQIEGSINIAMFHFTPILNEIDYR